MHHSIFYWCGIVIHSIAAPAAASEVTQITKSPVVLEVPDTSSDHVEAEIEDQDEVVEVEDDTEEDEEDDRWVKFEITFTVGSMKMSLYI